MLFKGKKKSLLMNKKQTRRADGVSNRKEEGNGEQQLNSCARFHSKCF